MKYWTADFFFLNIRPTSWLFTQYMIYDSDLKLCSQIQSPEQKPLSYHWWKDQMARMEFCMKQKVTATSMKRLFCTWIAYNQMVSIETSQFTSCDMLRKLQHINAIKMLAALMLDSPAERFRVQSPMSSPPAGILELRWSNHDLLLNEVSEVCFKSLWMKQQITIVVKQTKYVSMS